jgi:hypothetical protein
VGGSCSQELEGKKVVSVSLCNEGFLKRKEHSPFVWPTVTFMFLTGEPNEKKLAKQPPLIFNLGRLACRENDEGDLA